MSNIKTKRIIVLIFLAFLAVGACYFVWHRTLNTLPSIKVSLRVKEPITVPLSCRWIVENNSDASITFNAGDIRLVEIDGKSIEAPAGSQRVVLLPQQEWEENITISKLSGGYHTIQVTANCTQGSSASMSITVKVPS